VGRFPTIFNGFLDITSGFSATERDAMFCGNAQRVYRMENS
jgi:predicted TIM-barrel fold metal-dependent hydrolase